MKPLDHAGVRRRVRMFYFAAVLNLLMAVYVLAAGSAVADRGMLWVIAIVFLAFAALNYFVGNNLRKRWDAHVRQQLMNAAEEAQQ